MTSGHTERLVAAVVLVVAAMAELMCRLRVERLREEEPLHYRMAQWTNLQGTTPYAASLPLLPDALTRNRGASSACWVTTADSSLPLHVDASTHPQTIPSSSLLHSQTAAVQQEYAAARSPPFLPREAARRSPAGSSDPPRCGAERHTPPAWPDNVLRGPWCRCSCCCCYYCDQHSWQSCHCCRESTCASFSKTLVTAEDKHNRAGALLLLLLA